MLPSSLMGKPQRFAPTISGKIRPGIMVLTNKAKENPQAVAIYEDGVKNMLSFEEIKTQIEKKCGASNFMRPINMPYFSVRRQDFAMPEIADLLLQKYGEDRGEGIKLYRFPITFASDDITQILVFQFNSYTASGMKYWSDEDANQRMCMQFAEVKMQEVKQRNATVTRPIKMPAGRDVIARGPCMPIDCPEFQRGDCKMRGRLLFYVPGIPGTGLFEVPTGSKNFAFTSEQTLRQIQQLTNGKLRGLNGGKPVFWLTKRFVKDLPMIGEDGKPTRTDQWIIEITADIDMSRIAEGQNLLAAPSQGQEVANLLMPSVSAPDEAIPTSHVIDSDGVIDLASSSHTMESAVVTVQPVVDVHKVLPVPQEPAPVTLTPEEKEAIKVLRKDVAGLLELFGITPTQFDQYASYPWGPTWGKSLDTLKLAKNELESVLAFDDAEKATYKATVLAKSN